MLTACAAFLVLALPALAEDVHVREAGSETEEDIPQLILEATKGDWNTRIKAVHALGRLGSIEGLSEGVTDGDWQIRLTSVHWLGRQADAGVPALARVLRTEPCRIIRLAAIHWLGSIGPKSVPALRDALGESSPMIRLTSAYWLRRIEAGENGEESPPPAADDPGLLHGASQEDLRGCSAVNLPPTKVVLLPEPEGTLSAKSDPRRTPTARPGPNAAPMEEESAPEPAGVKPRRAADAKSADKKRRRTDALDLLAEAVPPKRAEDEEEEEAPPAARAPEKPLPGAVRPPVRLPEKPLADAAEPQPPASRPPEQPKLGAKLAGAPEEKLGPVPTWRLVRGSGEGDYELALQEPEAGAPPHDPVPDLVKALRSGNWRTRYRAADLLGMLGAQAAPAIADLTQAVKDKHPGVRASAVLALGNIGKPAEGAVGAITRCLRDKNADVRYSAAVALGRMGTPTADRAFQRHVRAEAARLIERE